MIELTPDLKLMSIGTDCKFLRIQERVKGPVDNILCLKPDYLQSLFDRSYTKKFVQGGYSKEKQYFIDSLGLCILHNTYNLKYIRKHLLRLENFYDFLSNIDKEDHYFMLNLGREDCDYNVLDFKKILIENNILEKTIVFGDSVYKNEFLNFFPVRVQKNGEAEDFFKSEYSLLSHFNKFTLRDIEFLEDFKE